MNNDKKSPIIFLNIDGVLISENFIIRLASEPDMLYRKIKNKYFMNFELSKIAILKKIIDETNAYIVIASSWNKNNNLNDFKIIFKKYGLDKRIIDITPYLLKKSGFEIKKWLDINAKKFKNLDKNNISIINNSEIGILSEYQIKPDAKVGITKYDADNVVKMLKKNIVKK